MIKEILEKNGYAIEQSTSNIRLIKEDEYYISMNMNDEYYEEGVLVDTILAINTFIKPENIAEIMCQQYIKENGFKLSWLDVNEIPNKLIAYLYAHDIEIINDIGE